jgi:hypothetical protein
VVRVAADRIDPDAPLLVEVVRAHDVPERGIVLVIGVRRAGRLRAGVAVDVRAEGRPPVKAFVRGFASRPPPEAVLDLEQITADQLPAGATITYPPPPE